MSPSIIQTSNERIPGGSLVSSRRADRRRKAGEFLSRYGLLCAWAVTILAFSVTEPALFLTSANLANILGSQAVLVVITLGLIFPLAAGEFDLSVGGNLGLAMTLIGFLNGLHHWPIWAAVLAAVLSGVAVGAINSFFVVVAGVPSLIATLGIASVLGGITYEVSNQTITGLSPSFVQLGQGTFHSIPFTLFYALLIAFALWYVIKWTPWGRYIYFVGASREVAKLSGIPVSGVRVASLVTSGFFAAVGGVILASTLGASGPDIGSTYLLPAFAAAFLGSTTIQPGRLNVWGSVCAAYFLVTGITGLQLFGVTSYIQDVFYGATLVVAVSLSRLARRR